MPCPEGTHTQFAKGRQNCGGGTRILRSISSITKHQFNGSSISALSRPHSLSISLTLSTISCFIAASTITHNSPSPSFTFFRTLRSLSPSSDSMVGARTSSFVASGLCWSKRLRKPSSVRSTTRYSLRTTVGTCTIWWAGQSSVYFLVVKMSVASKLRVNRKLITPIFCYPVIREEARACGGAYERGDETQRCVGRAGGKENGISTRSSHGRVFQAWKYSWR